MTIKEVIETLKEDYALRASLKRKNLTVQDELEDEIDDLEQSLIASKIIPELEQYAKTLLQDLECEIGLAVTKDANGNIVVKDEVFYTSSTPSQPIVVQPAASTLPTTTSSSAVLITSSNIQVAQGRDLRVTLNGKVIQESNSIQTFIKVLETIGLNNVAKVRIMCSGYNLVDTRQRLSGSRQWQHKVGDKWVYVYFGNIVKVKYLMQIANALQLNMIIEAI